jgi:hypothetical protein
VFAILTKELKEDLKHFRRVFSSLTVLWPAGSKKTLICIDMDMKSQA